MQLPTLLTILTSALLVSAQIPTTSINVADPLNTSEVAVNPDPSAVPTSSVSSSIIETTDSAGPETTSVSETTVMATPAASSMEAAGAKVTGLPGIMAAAGGMAVLGML